MRPSIPIENCVCLSCLQPGNKRGPVGDDRGCYGSDGVLLEELLWLGFARYGRHRVAEKPISVYSELQCGVGSIPLAAGSGLTFQRRDSTKAPNAWSGELPSGVSAVQERPA
jgi:hypothetical protein